MTDGKKVAECDDTRTEAGSGQPSYRGYEYQILATVWLGLELTTSGRVEAIIVEPPSAEDVAADLDVPAENAASHVEAGNLQIQIKMRNNMVWKSRDFKVLLAGRPATGTRGPAPRVRPLEYLTQGSTCRYVLLTNVDVDSSLQAFVISKIGLESAAVRIPGAKSDDPKLARRIAILPGEKSNLLKLKIHEILQARCHVPGARLGDCVHALTDRVRQRLVGTLANRFPSHEMQQVIREHGGSFRPPCEPVHPSNFGRIKEQILEKHALVLVGPPGTGKTTLARSLMAELETGSPPAQRVTVSDAADIEMVRRYLSDPHDHVYYFEDPWGQDVPGIGASFFVSELPKLMREARPGKRFVVTSRLGVFQQAVGTRQRLFQPYRQELHPKDYESSAYSELYDRQLVDWPVKHRNKAREYRAMALKLLETPYSVEIFCRALFDRIEAGERIYGPDVENMAKNSNVDSFGAVLKDRLIAGGGESIRSAIAIWAQLVVDQNTIDGNRIKTLRGVLRSGGMENPPDVVKLFNDLANARWFQSRSGGYVTTPSVRDALAQLEVDEPAAFEDTIGAVIRGWATANTFDAILACVRAAGGKQTILPQEVAGQFDSHLVSSALQAEGYKFTYAYNEIARFSQTNHPVAVLARGLSQRDKPPLGPFRSFAVHEPKWVCPKLDTSKITAIRTSAECRLFAQRFVTDYIPYEVGMRMFGNTYDHAELLDFLRQFGWPLLEWFRTAFADSVRSPDGSTGFLAECLCALDIGAVDTVFDACLAAFQQIETSIHEDPEEYRQHAQGEVDAMPEGAYDGESDRCYRAKSALTTTLKIKRNRDGYTWIAMHVNAGELLDPWSELLKSESTPEEREAFVACCDRHGKSNLVLSVIERKPDPRFCGWVATQLLTQPEEVLWPHSGVVEKYAALPGFHEALEKAARECTFAQRALAGFSIIVDRPATVGFGNASGRWGPAGTTETEPAYWESILAQLLTEDEKRLVVWCYAASLGSCDTAGLDPQRKDAEGLTVLVNEWPDVPAIHALEALGRSGASVESLLGRFLGSKDETVRARALRLCTDRSYLLTRGLQDADWHCRVAAMETLAPEASSDEREQMFGLVNDPSAYVRKAIALCIGQFRWPDGVSVLVRLLRDHREFGEQHSNDDFRIFEVARAACKALHETRRLPDDAIAAIRTFLGECEGASLDTTVHGLLFRILAEQPSEESFRFCALYFDKTWLGSKWRENGGGDLVVQCLHTISTMVQANPRWSEHLNMTPIAKVAARDEDDDWLVGPALVVLGLSEKSRPGQVEELAKLMSFGPDRARLLLSLSRTLQRNRSPGVMQHIPARHPFITLLDWAAVHGRQPPYDELRVQNPQVAEWVDSLKAGGKLAIYERWAVNRLIGSANISDPSAALPHPFLFDEERIGTRRGAPIAGWR